ncbi:MAG: GIN domain-containing protein [Cyclobacteriaceae bacterium]
MKFSLVFTLVLTCAISVVAQEQITPKISSFSKVVASDKVNLVLEEGDYPALRLSYVGVDPEDIVVKNQGQKLEIYLEGCRNGCGDEVSKAYQHAAIIAYVTYTSLKKLVIKGDNQVLSLSPIQTDRFILRSYGDNSISLRAVEADFWKTAFYGDSRLTVEEGEVNTLKVKTYGDHDIQLQDVASQVSKVHSLGDNNVRLQADSKIFLTVFGDATIQYIGTPSVDKRLVLGDLSLESL